MRDERLVPLRFTLITLARLLRFLANRVFDLALTIKNDTASAAHAATHVDAPTSTEPIRCPECHSVLDALPTAFKDQCRGCGYYPNKNQKGDTP